MARSVQNLESRVAEAESICRVMDTDLRVMVLEVEKHLLASFDAKSVLQNQFQSASFEYLQQRLDAQNKRQEELEENMSRIGLHQPWLHQPLQPTEKTNVSVSDAKLRRDIVAIVADVAKEVRKYFDDYHCVAVQMRIGNSYDDFCAFLKEREWFQYPQMWPSGCTNYLGSCMSLNARIARLRFLQGVLRLLAALMTL